jgi:hypothetical protein
MRLIALSAVALLASATAVLAAPAAVSVTVGPDLQKKAVETYGEREVQALADDLRTEVERTLARAGSHEDARVELVLTDAKPNRPTFKQLGDTLGLSPVSFGVGGASIEGRIVTATGAEIPVAYRWYEQDIRRSVGATPWLDAQWTFDRFAHRLARGQNLAQR